MNWVTQNAPFGTDNTPVLEVKIVGGKRVEVLADSDNDPNAGFQHKETISPPRGPHGTPSMLTQPMFRSYAFSDQQHGFNTAKQHQIAREVTSYTSPNGDRSRSFRHGAPLLNKHPVLPPIGASQPPGNTAAHPDEFFKQDFYPNSQHIDNQHNDDVSLDALVAHQLNGFRHDKLKDMYIELTGFDRHLTGSVNEAQLNLVAMRYDLPIKMSTLKMLLHKFRDRNESRSVKYEKLLQFLSQCLSSSPQKLKATDVAPSVERKSSVKKSATPLPAPGSEKDEKLLSLLRVQLSGSEEINVRDLNAAFTTADRLANGELPSYTVEKICVEQRLPLTSSVILKMLQYTETSHGNINWREFVDLLMRADERIEHGEVKKHATPTRTPSQRMVEKHESGMWKNGQTEASLPNGVTGRSTEIDGNFSKTYEGFHSSRHGGEVTASPTSSKQSRNMSTGWDEREPRPLDVKDQQKLMDAEVRKTETWIRNFTRLAHALRNYHPYKNDALPRGEVARMANNYNLIYGLGFSKRHLSEAISRAVTSHSKDITDQTVSVDKLLEHLAGMAE